MQLPAPSPSRTDVNNTTAGFDTTVTGNDTVNADAKFGTKIVKKKGKPKMSVKEKKERSVRRERALRHSVR
jgi:hypothetical protein